MLGRDSTTDLLWIADSTRGEMFSQQSIGTPFSKLLMAAARVVHGTLPLDRADRTVQLSKSIIVVVRQATGHEENDDWGQE